MLVGCGPDKTPFHGDPGEPAAKDQGIEGTGKIHAQHKNQMGKTIGQRAAHHDNPGCLQVDRDNTQGKNRRPTEQKAEADGKDPGKHHGRGFFPEGGQIGLLRNHLQADWLLMIGGLPNERQSEPVEVHLTMGNAETVKTKTIPLGIHPALRKIYIAKQALNMARLPMMGK